MPILEELPQSDILPRGSWTTELPEVKSPSVGELASAAFDNENDVVAGINALMRARNFKVVEGYSAFADPEADTRLLDQYPDRFERLGSPEERSAREHAIRREEANAEIIRSAGWAGAFMSAGAGIASPTMFLPGGAIYRAGRLGYRTGRTAVSVGGAAAGATAVQEGALHSFTHTRTGGQSAAAIGGSALFGGVIGAGAAGAARISRGEWDALLRARQRDAAEAGGFPLRPMTGEARYAEREVAPHVGPEDAVASRDANVSGGAPIDAARRADLDPHGETPDNALSSNTPPSKSAQALEGELERDVALRSGPQPVPTISREVEAPVVAQHVEGETAGQLSGEAVPAFDTAPRVGTGADRYIQREVRRYVRLNDDTDEFGYITSDIARTLNIEAAPIRLPEGWHNVQTDKGFGEVHIQARHGSQLAKAGYDDVAQFTLDVARRFDSIYEGHGGALILVRQGDRNEMAVVGLRPFGTKGDLNWEVTTAAIYNQKFFKNKKQLWSRPGPANSSPEGESPFTSEMSPRSQSQTNLAKASEDFKPARPVDVSPGSVEDAGAAADTTANAARQSSTDTSTLDLAAKLRLDKLAAESGSKFIYEAKANAYYSVENGKVGKIVDEADLPWPQKNGFASSVIRHVKEGTILDRYGGSGGHYLGEPGSTASARGLVPGSEGKPYKKYRVEKEFEMQVGQAAAVPEFNAVGGATQYYHKNSVRKLLELGFLEEIP